MCRIYGEEGTKRSVDPKVAAGWNAWKRAAIGWWPRSFYTLILSILSIPFVTFVKFIRDGTTIHRNILNSPRFIAETRHGTRRDSFMLDDGSFSGFFWLYWCWLYSYLVYAVNNWTYVATMKNCPYLKLLQLREKNHLYLGSKNLYFVLFLSTNFPLKILSEFYVSPLTGTWNIVSTISRDEIWRKTSMKKCFFVLLFHGLKRVENTFEVIKKFWEDLFPKLGHFSSEYCRREKNISNCIFN